MNPHTQQFNEAMESLVKNLQQAEHLQATTTNPCDPQLFQLIQVIHSQLIELKKCATRLGLASKMGAILKALTLRCKKLEYAPPRVIKAQIQSLLAFPNLCFVEGDLSVNEELNEPEVSRFVVLDRTGLVCFDETLNQSESVLIEYWPRLEHTLNGKYTMSYDYDFVLGELALAATHYPQTRLDTPALIGGSVEILFEQYAKGGHLSAMEPVLKEGALGRAQGILHILKEIANGQI
jgi:hypothetical protein